MKLPSPVRLCSASRASEAVEDTKLLPQGLRGDAIACAGLVRIVIMRRVHYA